MDCIKAWKENWLPWCKIESDMALTASLVGRANFLFWLPNECDFVSGETGVEFAPGTVYRLPEDFQCPHTEARPYSERDDGMKTCQWCGEMIHEKPKMRWKEIKIVFESCRYSFKRNIGYFLHEAFDLDGFGGIKYRAGDGKAETKGWLMVRPNADSARGPWIPIAVRFWEVLK